MRRGADEAFFFFSPTQILKSKAEERVCKYLEKLRREAKTWIACTGLCGKLLSRTSFSETQLLKRCFEKCRFCAEPAEVEAAAWSDTRRKAASEAAKAQFSATNLLCGGGCGLSFPRSEYSATQRDRGAGRKCLKCVDPTSASSRKAAKAAHEAAKAQSSATNLLLRRRVWPQLSSKRIQCQPA